jgi:hypothetical protein
VRKRETTCNKKEKLMRVERVEETKKVPGRSQMEN